LTKTLPWLRGLSQSVVQKSKLSEEQLLGFRFEAILLSKNSIGFGWLDYRQDIPICSERFLKWALIDQMVSLQRFWELASIYAFKPEEGIHYRPKIIRPQFGNIVFSAPIAFTPLGPMNVANDIRWT